jgi:diadenosine tetraphosphate (Ap4A) HIT family hydrolase
LSSSESAELAIIEREVATRLVQAKSSVLFFEHGIGKGASGGCGISHCHIHVMPLDQNIATSFIQRFRKLEFGVPGEHLSAISAKQSYTYVRLESDESTVAIARKGDFPSQFLRNLLEDTIGVPRSNWRDISQTQLFSETLVSTEWL